MYKKLRSWFLEFWLSQFVATFIHVSNDTYISRSHSLRSSHFRYRLYVDTVDEMKRESVPELFSLCQGVRNRIRKYSNGEPLIRSLNLKQLRLSNWYFLLVEWRIVRDVIIIQQDWVFEVSHWKRTSWSVSRTSRFPICGEKSCVMLISYNWCNYSH